MYLLLLKTKVEFNNLVVIRVSKTCKIRPPITFTVPDETVIPLFPQMLRGGQTSNQHLSAVLPSKQNARHRYFSSVNVRYTEMSDGLQRDVRRWMRQAASWLIDGKRRAWTLLNEVPDSSLPCTDGTAACVYFHPSGGLQTSTLLITLFWQGIKITENNLWVTDLTGMFATTQSYPLVSFFLSLSHREFIAPEYCEIY